MKQRLSRVHLLRGRYLTKLMITFFCGVSTSACSSCSETKGGYPAEEQRESSQAQCTQVGTQCRIRRGVLGVCLPGAPPSEEKIHLGVTKRKLICTPQH